MCTVIFAWGVFSDAPVVVAANRDELRSRPSAPPGRLLESPEVWGGHDLVAGGTWLAVDVTGRVAAVTNRHPGGRLPSRDPARRSRGELPTRFLVGRPSSVADLLRALSPADYNPVNVVYLDAKQARWASVDDTDGLRTGSLEPGVHVITEQDVDDTHRRKTARLREQAQRAAGEATSPHELARRWTELLSSHTLTDPHPSSAACIHESEYGTVSSATVVVDRLGVHYSHADGPPCVTPYLPVLGGAAHDGSVERH